MLVAEAQGRVARVLKLLSLTGCANTILGDELVKGVSGCARDSGGGEERLRGASMGPHLPPHCPSYGRGERRRVSIAEALVTNARVLALDEYSTGACVQ